MRMFRLLNPAMALLLASSALTCLHGQEAPAKPSRYPLRLHVLAVDETYPTMRLQPNWCSTSIPVDMGLDPASGAGGGATGGGNPCGGGSGAYAFGGPDDMSGSGRADLVSPPTGTQGLNFSYEGCNRVRVQPGFQGLQARWKKPGKALEVLIPTDDITSPDRAMPTKRCTLKVSLHEFVYLRLRSGKILQVTQEGYWSKPALRTFLSGGTQTLQERNVVSVQQLAQPAAPQTPPKEQR